MKQLIQILDLVRFNIITSLVILTLLIVCKKTPLVQEAEEKSPIETSVKLTAEQMQARNIQITEVQPTPFAHEISLIGEVAGNPDKLHTISAKVGGIVKSVHFIEGKQVTKGSLLVVIESPEIATLRSKYFSAYSKYKAANSNITRLKELGKLRLASEQEVLNAEAEYKMALSELNANKENLSMMNISLPDVNNEHIRSNGNIEIRSPSNGIIISRNVVQGARVEAATVLGSLGDISELWFMVKIFEKDLSQVSEGTPAAVILNSYPGLVFDGVLEYIGNSIDMGSRTVNGRIVIQNIDKKIKIGLFGRALVKNTVREVLGVPETAITILTGNHYVIKEIATGEFQLQKIELGEKSKDLQEVTMGLSNGDKVVTVGLYELKSMILKSTFGED
jgi:membrane fusion protein, heavy metal efflux system